MYLTTTLAAGHILPVGNTSIADTETFFSLKIVHFLLLKSKAVAQATHQLRFHR